MSRNSSAWCSGGTIISTRDWPMISALVKPKTNSAPRLQNRIRPSCDTAISASANSSISDSAEGGDAGMLTQGLLGKDRHRLDHQKTGCRAGEVGSVQHLELTAPLWN